MTSSRFSPQIAILPTSAILLELVPMAVTEKTGNGTTMTATVGRVEFGVQTASVMLFETNDDGKFHLLILQKRMLPIMLIG